MGVVIHDPWLKAGGLWNPKDDRSVTAYHLLEKWGCYFVTWERFRKWCGSWPPFPTYVCKDCVTVGGGGPSRGRLLTFHV